MATSNRSLSFDISVNTSGAESNVSAFTRFFKEKLAQLATPVDFKVFQKLVKDIDSGKTALSRVTAHKLFHFLEVFRLQRFFWMLQINTQFFDFCFQLLILTL